MAIATSKLNSTPTPAANVAQPEHPTKTRCLLLSESHSDNVNPGSWRYSLCSRVCPSTAYYCGKFPPHTKLSQPQSQQQSTDTHRRGCLLAFGKMRAIAPVSATDRSGLGRSGWVQGQITPSAQVVCSPLPVADTQIFALSTSAAPQGSSPAPLLYVLVWVSRLEIGLADY